MLINNKTYWNYRKR